MSVRQQYQSLPKENGPSSFTYNGNEGVGENVEGGKRIAKALGLQQEIQV